LPKRLFGPPDFFGLRSHLGNGNLLAPYTYQNCDQSLKICARLQSLPLAELSPAKGYVNDWLTVTNWIPPVNDAQGHFRVTEGG
jgi:hypothetical protein